MNERAFTRPLLAVSILTVVATAPAAARPTPAPRRSTAPGLVALRVEPARILLSGADAKQPLLVTGRTRDGRELDLSHEARIRSADPRRVRVEPGGVLRPLGDGSTRVLVMAGGLTAAAEVRVLGAAREQIPRFVTDVLPVLTRAGCSTGGCHGKATGQNGFKLSLFGFDPAADFAALTREGGGRRVARGRPKQSLILLKAAGALPHGGGVRLREGSAAFRLVARWIAAGAGFGPEDQPTVTALRVLPAARTLAPGARQRLLVTAVYSDGTERDVTSDADLSSNDPVVAAPELARTPRGHPGTRAPGVVRAVGPTGEAVVMARYMGQVAVARILVPRRDPLYRFPQIPVYNPVDSAVYARLRQLQVTPALPASDAVFLRRVSLDLTGTLPTVEEARAFLAECDAERQTMTATGADTVPRRARQRLVERLLARPEYADFWALKWADLLRNNSRIVSEKGAQAFHGWIRQSLAENQPYDRFVREILTASGPGYQRGAVNFYRVTNEALDAPAELTNAVTQVFLGTRMECAQCHHHPYERWGQDDFYGIAAFFGRLKKERSKDGDIAYVSAPRGEVRHPRTRRVVAPRVPDGPPLSVAEGEDPRVALAAWATGPDNPFLARALANRLWAHFFGRGIVEPIDDLRVTNPPSNPALLDLLAGELTSHGYDVKHLLRLIVSSRVYQLSGETNSTNRRDAQSYSRALPRRLSAEVLLDAVSQVTGVAEVFEKYPAGTRAMQVWDNHARSYFLDTFGRPLRVNPCECERSAEGNLSQALHLLNSPALQAKLTAEAGAVARLARSSAPEEELIETLYLACLSRPPTAGELRAARSHLARLPDRRAAAEDLLWALINTREFLFNH